jgi:hypothetical protein
MVSDKKNKSPIKIQVSNNERLHNLICRFLLLNKKIAIAEKTPTETFSIPRNVFLDMTNASAGIISVDSAGSVSISKTGR